MLDIDGFIRRNLRLGTAPGIPEIQLYQGHAGSGLSRLSEDGPPPYWAYGWAGGTVLARYILEHREIIAGRRVLDLGCGSGIVAIAAALAGADEVLATDNDPHALVATQLNAQVNAVAVSLVAAGRADVDLILAGDVFYDKAVADVMTPYLQGCVTDGIDVLVGDPGRQWLPRHNLKPLAEYVVPDFGRAKADLRPSAVYAFQKG